MSDIIKKIKVVVALLFINYEGVGASPSTESEEEAYFTPPTTPISRTVAQTEGSIEEHIAVAPTFHEDAFNQMERENSCSYFGKNYICSINPYDFIKNTSYGCVIFGFLGCLYKKGS